MADPVRAQLIKGVEAHKAGRLKEAEEAYRRVLNADAKNPDALNLLAVLTDAAGRSEEALGFYDRAIAVNPRFAEAHHNRGVALRALGRKDAAIVAFLQAIALNSGFADAYVNLGTTYADAGDQPRALETFTKMSKKFPQDVRAFYNLGHCLARAKRTAEAKVAFAQGAHLQPASLEIQIALADVNEELGDYTAALSTLERALQLGPTSIDVHDRLPPLLLKAGQAQEAVEAYGVAIALANAVGDARRRSARLSGLGDAYRALGDWTQAVSSYERALFGIEPIPEVVHKIAEVMGDREWLAAAGVLAEDAVRMRPDDYRYVHNLAIFELKRGQLASGWEKYEARIKANNAPEPYAEPRWSGQDLAGRRIVVWPEQGIGDQILYSGLLPEIIARAGEVAVEVEPRLVGVLTRSFPRARIFAGKGDGATSIPGVIDYQIPMGSLPGLLRRDFRQFPKRGAYLKADPDRTAELRQRYAAQAAGRRIVGISWRSRNAQFGTSKSIELRDFARILRAPDVLFVSLQYGECADEIAAAARDLGANIFHDPEIDSLVDLEDFFAQVAAMDLVISISNTTVHAAGALNVPTWLLLPRGEGALWYWFRDRSDSPWYPSVRIFRQPDAVDGLPWPNEVVKVVAEELQRRGTPPQFTGAPANSVKA